MRHGMPFGLLMDMMLGPCDPFRDRGSGGSRLLEKYMIQNPIAYSLAIEAIQKGTEPATAMKNAEEVVQKMETELQARADKIQEEKDRAEHERIEKLKGNLPDTIDYPEDDHKIFTDDLDNGIDNFMCLIFGENFHLDHRELYQHIRNSVVFTVAKEVLGDVYGGFHALGPDDRRKMAAALVKALGYEVTRQRRDVKVGSRQAQLTRVPEKDESPAEQLPATAASDTK